MRIRIALPAGGPGERLTQMHQWLDQNAGADGWSMTAGGTRGIANDAVAVFFADTTVASGFVVRWCAGHRAEALTALYRLREDEPKKRTRAPDHKSPP